MHNLLHKVTKYCISLYVCESYDAFHSAFHTAVCFIQEDADKASIDAVCGALKASRNVSFLPRGCIVCVCLIGYWSLI